VDVPTIITIQSPSATQLTAHFQDSILHYWIVIMIYCDGGGGHLIALMN